MARKISILLVCLLGLAGCGGGRSAGNADGYGGESVAMEASAGGDSGGRAAWGGEAEVASVSVGGTTTTSSSVAIAPATGTAGTSAIAPTTTTGAAPAVTTTTTSTTTVTVNTQTTTQIAPVEPVEAIPQHALLTAASVGDVNRRDNYLEFLARHGREGNELGIDVSRRLRIRVVDDFGRPVNDAEVRVDTSHGTVMGRTHADGIWDFHPSFSVPGASGSARVSITVGQTEVVAQNVAIPHQGDGAEHLVRVPRARAVTPTTLDLGFAIDVTGSMEDELRYINAEIADIVQSVRRAAPETRIRVGATFYRDRTDREVVQQIAFTDDVAGFARAMQTVRASGGGDYPEDMNAGLEAALSRMAWSSGNAVRVLVLVADAPPKRYADAQFTYRDALFDAQARGIRVLPVAASGADRTVEYLFRAMGSITSTPYVYLTDDSGIGHPHMDADTDRVAVEYFADLLTRLVVSDLRGEGMHEPGMFGPYRQ